MTTATTTRTHPCTRSARLFIASAALMALAAMAPGQSRQIPAPPQERPIVIRAATVHTITGETFADDGYVVLRDGLIADVGRGEVNVPPGAEVIDATGLHVYPGLVAASTNLGLTETSSVSETQDYSELGEFKPEVRAAVAINPDSELIPVTRANGILTAMVMPSGGLVAGRCSAVRLDGWTWESMTIRAEAGLLLNWPRTDPIIAWWMRTSAAEQRKQIKSNLRKIDDFFDEAADYIRSRDHDPAQPPDSRFEAMRAALAGIQPVYIRADSPGQIESAVAWAVRRNLRCVIVGGTRADEAIDILVKYDVPVIVAGTHRMPRRRHDAYDQAFTLPATLHEAGVRFCIASGAQAAHERNLNHNAGTAVAFGLPHDVALRAVTIDAARLIGLGSSHGSIEPGKAATLIVTTGDPLEITSDVLMAFIDGRRIDLGSRHKMLYEKYRQKYRQLGLIGDESPGADLGP